MSVYKALLHFLAYQQSLEAAKSAWIGHGTRYSWRTYYGRYESQPISVTRTSSVLLRSISKIQKDKRQETIAEARRFLAVTEAKMKTKFQKASKTERLRDRWSSVLTSFSSSEASEHHNTLADIPGAASTSGVSSRTSVYFDAEEDGGREDGAL
ncbi:MAG: hypothetical protein LQ352_002721 [Teloschistes flavicans]|nr:MAG: hypothetical protein LQ352_002721 [Teloschistes flavicans]